MDKKIILVLDKLEYKEYENEYLKVLKTKFNNAEVIYTEYEDKYIRRVRNWKYIGGQLQHLLYWRKSYNYAKYILKKNPSTIICINPIVGIFLGMLNRSENIKIILCGFLFETKKSKIYYELRKRFAIHCLKGVQFAVVYASQEVDYYNRIFSGIDKFVFMPYGIDYLVEEQYEGNLPDSYIFSGGGSNRDYSTLVRAYHRLQKDKELELPPLCIATLPRCLEGVDTTGIIVLTDVVLETFGDVIKHSMFMVLSLKDTELSAGHQVMLEAMKNNVPVLVNRIRAVEDYVSDEDVTFFCSNDDKELAEKMKAMLQNRHPVKTKNLYFEKYSFRALLERLINLI